jgi:hypothetical protein
MSEIALLIASYVLAMPFFSVWVVWLIREVVISIFVEATKVSSLTGLILTCGVLLNSAVIRVGISPELLRTHEIVIVIILVVTTPFKILMKDQVFRNQDVPLLLIVAVLSLLAAFEINLMIWIAIMLGLSLGTYGVISIKGAESRA